MKHRRLVGEATNLEVLAERLSKCSKVVKFDRGKHKEAWVLAHAFGDLEESFRKFLDIQLRRLVQEQLSEFEIEDLLLEIGEEFRHILYHIRDPKFYRYL